MEAEEGLVVAVRTTICKLGWTVCGDSTDIYFTNDDTEKNRGIILAHCNGLNGTL